MESIKRDKLREDIDELSGTNDSEWLADILTLMINNLDNAEIQHAACRALQVRIALNPSICNLIGEESNRLLPLHLSVLAALNIHVNDVYVFQAACTAIYEMARNSKTLQQYLVAKGAYVPIIEEMKKHRGEIDTHGFGCHALRALAFQNPYFEELIFKYDILTLLEYDIKTFCDPNVLKECIGLVTCLAVDLEIAMRQCVNLRIPQVILMIAVKYSTSEEIIAMALEALAVFYTSEERQLFQIEYVIKIGKMMERNERSSRIQLVGCIVMQLISGDVTFISNLNVATEMMKVISSAMRRFEDDVAIQIEGCIAIYLLLAPNDESSSARKDMAIKNLIDDSLFTIIEYFRSNDEVTLLAHQVLLHLASDQHIKDILLQRASLRESLRCVEYMILLGANVDAGGSNFNPLKNAVENDNLKLVELLLYHDASDVHSALRLSLQHHKWEIAGVLLRHIGYEIESRMIHWSGLHIGQLQPQLFLPTLRFKRELADPLQSPSYSPTEDMTGIYKRRKSYSFNENMEKDDNSNTPFRMQMTKTRSTSSLSTDDGFAKVSRHFETMSLSTMPYNSLDPRLNCNNSRKKYTIIPSPVNGLEYPGHPEGHLLSDPTFGSLLSVERCLTPLMIMKNKEDVCDTLSRSNSHLNVFSSCDNHNRRSASFVDISLTPPAKMKRLSPRRHTASNSSSVFEEHQDDNIKLLDISHNNITDLKMFAEYPSTLFMNFLQNLEKLDLSNNKLVSIPPLLYRYLPRLRTLNLCNNTITEFPYQLMSHQQIESLDLSGNCVSKIDFAFVSQTYSLHNLDLSKNKLREFPFWMGERFPRLAKLFLAYNKISQIGVCKCEFSCLKDLQISHNRISSVDESLWRCCKMLEKLDLSYNELITLPNYVPDTLSRLSHIKLSHNKIKGKPPFHIPTMLLSIPSIKFIDVSDNSITQLPQPQSWSSRGIRELIFSHNQIFNLNFNNSVGIMLPCLSRLNLCHNKLDHIPSQIGLITSLCSLDFSHNPITVLPDEIGRLVNLYEFPLRNLRLRHQPAVLKGNPQDIVSYFGSKLKNAIQYLRIKLMLVGPAGRGKTSLIRRLASMPNPTYNISTIGIDVNNWVLKPPKQKINKKLPSFTMNTWDFAGQEDFYSTHQYFLSSRALYIAVYDLTRGKNDIETLTPWLLSIEAAVPKSMVVLVGTHADKIPGDRRYGYLKEYQDYINEYSQSPGFPAIRSTTFVDCTSENRSVECLRDIIYEIISNFTYDGQPVIEQMVPKSYVDLEDLIQAEAVKLSRKNELPIQSKKQLWQKTVDSGILLNSEEFDRATKFLNDTGSLLNFNDVGCNLKNLYFIDPQWLFTMMARVVTVKEINPFITTQGILSKKDSMKLFPDANYSKEFLDQYFRLLRKFEVILPISDDNYIVTSKLPSEPPFNLALLREEVSRVSKTIVRRYIFPFIPNGFWARLITRMILFGDSFCSTDSNQPSNCNYWRNGMYICWSTNRFFIVSTLPGNTNAFDLITPRNKMGFVLLGNLVDIIDNFIEEWYPGLTGTSVDMSSQIIERVSPCYECALEEPHFFHLEECIDASYESETIECPKCGPVLIKAVAPDTVFGELEEEYVYENCPVVGNERDLLGSGGFASVYKANVEGVDLAVKVFGKTDEFCPNRLLRQEVDILMRLHHPCLISIIGVTLRPRMLLLEYAPLGNLESTLTSGFGLCKGIQHRIAIQISEGLSYLHDNRIVYRDLKPSNVLVFSLSKEELINIKLSDYGISQIATSLGLMARKFTYGYQAPEVTQGENEYNLEVDIFSFGVTFYEIMTCGKKPYGDVPFQHEFDKAVLANKPIESITSHGCTPWPDAEMLVRTCLAPNPAQRPTAKQIRDILLTVDLPCLKREIAICKDQSVECLAIRQVQNCQTDMEVWVGSGESGSSSQLSWFSLNGGKKKNIQGMMLKGRILCMETYLYYIIVGTKEGSIYVYDGHLKKLSHSLSQLADSVLCLTCIPRRFKIAAGLANGTIAMYDANEVVSKDSSPAIISLNDFMTDGNCFRPVACINFTREHMLCSYGPYIFKLRIDDYRLRGYWQVSPKRNGVVSSINVSKSKIFTSCKDSSVLSVWDGDKTEAQYRLDCFDILCKHGYPVSKRDSRILSVTIVDQNILWVGCDSGHVMIIDTLRSNPITSHILWRHVSGVRAISTTIPGAPLSVVTSGIGFRQPFNPNHTEFDYIGYVLVWEADLVKQKRHLENERKRRDEVAAELTVHS